MPEQFVSVEKYNDLLRQTLTQYATILLLLEEMGICTDDRLGRARAKADNLVDRLWGDCEANLLEEARKRRDKFEKEHPGFMDFLDQIYRQPPIQGGAEDEHTK